MSACCCSNGRQRHPSNCRAATTVGTISRPSAAAAVQSVATGCSISGHQIPKNTVSTKSAAVATRCSNSAVVAKLPQHGMLTAATLAISCNSNGRQRKQQSTSFAAVVTARCSSRGCRLASCSSCAPSDATTVANSCTPVQKLPAAATLSPTAKVRSSGHQLQQQPLTALAMSGNQV
jgi:hypothetical protein